MLRGVVLEWRCDVAKDLFWNGLVVRVGAWVDGVAGAVGPGGA